MEKKRSLINVLLSLTASFVNIAITLVAQKIFLSILNTEYLGLNGLFSNIVTMLGIFELGIGTAIIFSLYKPLADDDRATVKGLMAFYKKAYTIIAFIVLVVGLSITPFIPYLIKQVSIDINIYVIYIMFIADIFASYLLSYRRSILYADRKNYQISIVHIIYLLLLNSFQLLILFLTKNYYLYLSIKIIMRIGENYAIHIMAKHQYPYLSSSASSKLDKRIEKKIFKSVRALFLHKIGGFIVLGSDNIIISKFIGLVEVGLYSNYYIVINATYTIIGQSMSALTPSIGHMLATRQSEKTFDAFKKIRFANFCLSCITSVGFFFAIQPFVTIWLGKEYLFSELTVFFLAINMFQRLQRYSFSTFKEAAGIFHEDRFVPIIESIVNIVASLLLLRPFGVAGVFMGTAISDLTLWLFSYPKYVYKKLFNRSYLDYARETFGYVFMFFAILLATRGVRFLVNANGAFSDLILSVASVVLITALSIIIVFRKNSSYKYYKKYVLQLMLKLKR